MIDRQKLQNLIEAVLFYKGEPMKVSALAKVFNVTDEEIRTAIKGLAEALKERGLSLVEDRETVALATSAEAQNIIEAMRREELEGPLGKAGLETLAVVMYQGPVSRADIEYVRGVNCSSILRSLTMRGLIEKKENPKDKRGYIYQTTPELPASLGLTSVSEMPDFEEMRTHIASVLSARDAEVVSENHEE